MSFTLPEIPSVADALVADLAAMFPLDTPNVSLQQLPPIPKVAGSLEVELQHLLFLDSAVQDVVDNPCQVTTIPVKEEERVSESSIPAAVDTSSTTAPSPTTDDNEVETVLLGVLRSYKSRRSPKNSKMAKRNAAPRPVFKRESTDASSRRKGRFAPRRHQRRIQKKTGRNGRHQTHGTRGTASPSKESARYRALNKDTWPSSNTTSAMSATSALIKHSPITPDKWAQGVTDSEPEVAQRLVHELRAKIGVGIQLYNELGFAYADMEANVSFAQGRSQQLEQANEALQRHIEDLGAAAYIAQSNNQELAVALQRRIDHLDAQNRDLQDQVNQRDEELEVTRFSHDECIEENRRLTRLILDRADQMERMDQHNQRLRVRYGTRVFGLRVRLGQTNLRVQDLRRTLTEERASREAEREQLKDELAGMRRELEALANLAPEWENRTEEGVEESSRYVDALEYQPTAGWKFFGWARSLWK